MVLLERTDNFIRITVYQYIMPKQKITISLDSEIAKQLRMDSIEKYGDARSMSRLIEDLATNAAKVTTPSIEDIKVARSEYIKRTNMGNVGCSDGETGTCGFQPERSLLCNACGWLFVSFPSISLCCPACRSLDLKYIEDKEYFERKRNERRSIPPLTEEEKRIVLNEKRVELEKISATLKRPKRKVVTRNL